MKITFTPRQRRIITACTVLYIAAYFCRLNLAAVLDPVAAHLSLSLPQAGLLQTVFAGVYACGQLANGAVVDRVNPVRHMFIGLFGAAMCNMMMGFAGSYPGMIALWAMNGVFQSMMWTPIMRIVTLYYDDTATRERANGTLAMTLIVGHFGAWAISGFLGELLDWRFAFIVPAAIALTVLAVSMHALRDVMADAQRMNTRRKAQATAGHPALHALIGTGFPLVLITCVLYGFIRDSVVTWSPTILARLSADIVIPSTVFTLILPAINIFGVTIGFALRYRGAKPHVVVTMMMAVAIVSGAALLPAPGILITAVLLGLICAGMYGANTMLTALIPLQYDRIGRTGMTAGMVDSTIYAGSAIAGVLGGSLYEGAGAPALYAAWIFAAAACAALMMTALSMSRKYWRN